ncbi:MAG: OsmC family protein [Polyangiaceae bacterium]|nr:OsmC family protein [Polyangiaceae bacterium]
MPSVPKPHEFACSLTWTGAAAGPTVNYRSYSRSLQVEMVGKPALAMSAAPPFLGDSATHNPEDLLIAALSACHCLSYLALAARAGISVVAYSDNATATMEYVGKTYRFTKALLRPRVVVKVGTDLSKAHELHHEAHAACFIAQSMNFEVANQPEIVVEEVAGNT